MFSLIIQINMDTYHAAYWSDPSYSSSEEDNDRYITTVSMCFLPSQIPWNYDLFLNIWSIFLFVLYGFLETMAEHTPLSSTGKSGGNLLDSYINNTALLSLRR